MDLVIVTTAFSESFVNIFFVQEVFAYMTMNFSLWPNAFFVLGMEVVITVLVNVLETTLEMTALVLAVRITAMNEGAAFQCILFLNVIVMENTEETLAMSLFA